MPRYQSPRCSSEMVLLMQSFAFGIKTSGEMTPYGKSGKYPPAVIWNQQISDFWGQMLQTQLAYVILRPYGTCDLWMKNMVPVPEMNFLLGRDFPTPLGRSLPHSLALERDQILSAGTLRSLSRESCFHDASWGGVARAAM